jgi:hypothetical protein
MVAFVSGGLHQKQAMGTWGQSQNFLTGSKLFLFIGLDLSTVWQLIK